LQIGVEGHAELQTVIIFAVDPEVELSVLTGNDLVEHMIANLRRDVVRDDDEDTSTSAASGHLRAEWTATSDHWTHK
jgi:hypothetical protein